MHELSYETRQQYHKHGVMHRAFYSIEKLPLQSAKIRFFSMVHNGSCLC